MPQAGATYERDPEVTSCELAGGAALLDLKSSTYYTLNVVGAQVWSVLERPCSLAELVESVTSRFDVDRQKCEVDMLKLLDQLIGASLVRTGG